ncbi:NTP transferase domain-containing protein [Pendulispora rubella]|uniref:NTP transferase domain-containing protein n=1 Tax=Pendulispora rubella TaxID=2741070 RepID=A0ABZ2L6K9_9BACT
MTVDAVVLGAGRGQRIGGPKALLEIDGLTLAERHVQRALLLRCRRVVLVVRPEVAEVLDASACPSLTIARSEAPDPAGSLAVGLRALGEGERILVTPVDAFPASQETFTALRAALDDGAQAATPLFKERGGHPVLCRCEVLAPYRSALPLPLRDVLHALGAARVRVPVDDPAIGVDLDTPEDFRNVANASPRFAARVVFREAHLHG